MVGSGGKTKYYTLNEYESKLNDDRRNANLSAYYNAVFFIPFVIFCAILAILAFCLFHSKFPYILTILVALCIWQYIIILRLDHKAKEAEDLFNRTVQPYKVEIN